MKYKIELVLDTNVDDLSNDNLDKMVNWIIEHGIGDLRNNIRPGIPNKDKIILIDCYIIKIMEGNNNE